MWLFYCGFSIPSHEQLWWSLLWQCFAALLAWGNFWVMPTKCCSRWFQDGGCPCISMLVHPQLVQQPCEQWPASTETSPVVFFCPGPKMSPRSGSPKWAWSYFCFWLLCLVADVCRIRCSMIPIVVLLWKKQHIPPVTIELLRSGQ